MYGYRNREIPEGSKFVTLVIVRISLPVSDNEDVVPGDVIREPEHKMRE